MTTLTGLPAEAHPAFRFLVQVDGVGDVYFTECTLPPLEVDLDEQKEGGFNTGTHWLPGPVKAGRITLKGGITHRQEFLHWYRDVFAGHPGRAIRNITVTMLDSLQTPVFALNFTRAFPYKWSGPTLRSDDNSIAIETLELAFAEVVIV